MAELLLATLPVLLGPGGVLVVWLTLRQDRKAKREGKDVTMAEAKVAEATHSLESSGVAEAWRAYSAEMEARLNARIAELDAQRAEDAKAAADAARTITALYQQARELHARDLAWRAYAEDLRRDLHNQVPPPPRPYPPQLEAYGPPPVPPHSQPTPGPYTD